MFVSCVATRQVFNPYYLLLAEKLLGFEYSHRVTMQYNLWDRLRVMEETKGARRLYNLARLVAGLISTHTLTLAVFKVGGVHVLGLSNFCSCRLVCFV